MYETIRSQGLSTTIVREAPAATGALVVAEVFYKFHSFTLEFLAFLLTWWAFGWVTSRVARLIGRDTDR